MCCDEPGTLDVDELAAEYVIPQQHLALSAAKLSKAQLLPRETDLSRFEAGNSIGRNEELAAPDARPQPRDGRKFSLGESDDYVLDAAEFLACSVEHRAADHRGDR